MRICLKRIRWAAVGIAAVGLLVPHNAQAGLLSSAMSAASHGGASMGKALSGVRSSGTYQRLKGSVSSAGKSALSGGSAFSSKARQAITSSSTLQRMKQGIPSTGSTQKALSGMSNARLGASNVFNKATTGGIGAMQQSMGHALAANRSVFSQFQQKLPTTMAAFAAPNGNTGIAGLAGIAAPGQPLDSLSNLTNAMKAKVGIQGPILPPALTNQLKQSEVLRAMVTHPQLSNAKTQFVNKLQASGVDVTKLKADLNMVLSPNQPLNMNALAGNMGLAGVAAQGQPLDSLSNLATALKAKAGIQGPILPPAVTERLKQSEVLQAIVTHPELSNKKTQFINKLQAAGVDVTKLKADLNQALDPNQPFNPNLQNGLNQILVDAGIIPQPPGNIDVVGNPPVVDNGGVVPLPPNGFDPVGQGNNAPPNNDGGGNGGGANVPAPPAPPAPAVPPGAPVPPANPQVAPFPWEQVVANIPLYLALTGGLGGGQGGGGGGGFVDSGPVSYQPAPIPEEPVAAPPVEGTATVDLMLEDVQLAAPATIVAGPAYLVTLRNQSTIPVGRFHVAVLAGLNGSLTESAPQASSEVALLQPGEATSVLLRLPNTAMQMISNGQVTQFTHLFVATDLMNAIAESDESNNIAILDRTALEGANR
jgi:hypothetical protein